MPKKITNKFKLNQVELITADLSTNTSPHFVFLARHLPYRNAEGNTIDDNPPEVDTSVDGTTFDIYRNMIYAKKIGANDVAPMVRYTMWSSGVVYDEYDHRDPSLATKDWFVVVKRGTNYDVFICIGNNNRGISTIAPSYHDSTPAESGGYETLTDRYRWKYMYTVTQQQYDKFATSGYIPVFPNADVTGNSVPGSIDYVSVTYAGSGYDSYHSGLITESVVGGDQRVYTIGQTAAVNSHFYDGCVLTIVGGPGLGQMRTIVDYSIVSSTIKRVRLDEPFQTIPTGASSYEITPAVVLAGDGSRFAGRALVNAASSNSIWKVEVIDRGVNYTWADATVVGNTGGTTNFALIAPIISPYNGHGSNAAEELEATALGVSVSFSSAESVGRVLDVNEFRTIGIIKKPMFQEVTLTVDNSNNFEAGDYVVQTHTGAYGYVDSVPTTTTMALTNVIGYFVTGQAITANTGAAPSANITTIVGQATYVDQTTKYNLATINGNFEQDELITQASSNARVYSANSTVVRATNIYGAFVSTETAAPGQLTTIAGQVSLANAAVASIASGEFKHGSGEVLYIDNKLPIAKSPGQNETVKIILEF